MAHVQDLTVETEGQAIDRPALRSLPGSRRGSGSFVLSTGQTMAYHTRTNFADEGLPHATTKQYHRRLFDEVRETTRFDTLHSFSITPQRMRMVVDAFVDAMDKGLKEPNQVVPMFPTFVFGWPQGNEEGDFLAVDLGGTNLRVCLVTLGNGQFELTQAKYRLTEEQKQEDGQKLFDFCAECLDTFIKAQVSEGYITIQEGEKLSLGFTFSYPTEQERIDHGKLVRWTKGFGAPNTEGRDVAAMFIKSLEKKGIPVELTALINDTTGALIASHYVNPSTRIGCVFGTGCNAAYMEKVENIQKLNHLNLPPEAEMAINCEWGAFDSFHHEHLPRTQYDKIVDETSNKPKEQAFEKLISGRYLGEIMRLILCELIDEGVLFLGQSTYKLEIPYAFDTAFLSLMESDPTDEQLMTIGIFSHFFGIETTLVERQFFRSLAHVISTRAARLSACGIAALVRQIGCLEEGCSVGADGTLYNKYPGFADRMHKGLIDIFGEKGRNILTHHAEDGSGVGSAIIASMTKKRRDAGLYLEC